MANNGVGCCSVLLAPLSDSLEAFYLYGVAIDTDLSVVILVTDLLLPPEVVQSVISPVYTHP